MHKTLLWLYFYSQYQSLHKKISVGSGEKNNVPYICKSSIHVIILITWILTDARKSKNIQKKRNLVEKLEFSIGRIILRFLEKEVCTNEKVKQTFLQHLPVPVQQVVKSFKVVIIPVLYVEKTATCRFPVNLWWIQNLMHTSKG